MKKITLNRNEISVFRAHDHQSCHKNGIDALEKHCHKNKLHLTPLRRRVFEFLLKDHKPLGAYEILDLLRRDGFSSKPPIAYRVLDFLIEQGFVHKIHGLNSFVACSHPGSSHSPAFIICRRCDKVAEIEEAKKEISIKKVVPSNFKIEQASVEMTGICGTCNALETTYAD